MTGIDQSLSSNIQGNRKLLLLFLKLLGLFYATIHYRCKMKNDGR